MAFHLLQSMKSDTDNVQICQKVLNSQDIMRKGCQIIQDDFPLMQVQNYCNILTSFASSFILHLLSHGIAAHQFRELFMEEKKKIKKQVYTLRKYALFQKKREFPLSIICYLRVQE